MSSCGSFLDLTIHLKLQNEKNPRILKLGDVLKYLTMSLISIFVQARNKVTEIINNAITSYRDDIDLQNLIDFGQREVKV